MIRLSLIVVVDMDDCIVDFLNPLINTYNNEKNTNIKLTDITEWSLSKYDGMTDIFKRPGFFYNLKPFPDAVNALHDLQERHNHQIIIASNPMGLVHATVDKIKWISRYLPFIPKNNIMLTGRKDLIKGDIIFDDCPEYINGFNKVKMINDRPYNQNTDAHYRIKNNRWLDFYSVVLRLGYAVKNGTDLMDAVEKVKILDIH